MGAAIFVACGDKAASEPSLIGKWVSDTLVKNEDKGVLTTVCTLDFRADSTLARDMKMSFTLEDKGTKLMMPFEVGYDSKFSADGKNIICTGDSASFRFKVEKDSVKVTSDDPTMQALADKVVTSMLKDVEKNFGGSIKNESMSSDTTAYIFEGELLKLVEKNDTIVLHKVQ